MIKFNRLAFILVMVVTILLALGNWASPAQANNSIVGTPTGTPSTNPNGQGEPVSAEEQEALKAVIQEYFEIRYDARSMSHASGFRLEGFGDLMSAGPDAQAFLDAELGKLALERKYAELNWSRYVDYKYLLEFNDLTMDTATQLVTVSVMENNEIISEISAARNPANPHVARMYGLEHTIVLRKEQEQWRIVSDHYNDFIWRTMREKGEMVQEMLSMLETMEAPPLPPARSEGAGTETVLRLPADPSSHAYDREEAAFYAFSHAAPDFYNINYYNFSNDGGDCTNFVSQAIYEGGKASMDVESNPTLGGYQWYYLNERQRAAAWNQVDNFYNFVTTPDYWSEGPEGYELGPVPEGQWPAGLMVGDVIQYEAHWDAEWDHSVIVVDFDPATGAPLVASHTPNWPSVDFMAVVAHVRTRFIHIERSDGNPPIKAQITSNHDDASGYTLAPSVCMVTNPDPGNNYVGRCLNGAGELTSGFLFRNVQIPRGAQIKYAYVTFTTDGTYVVQQGVPGVFAPIRLQVYGENSVSPLDFSPTNPLPSDRTNFITAPVPWYADGTNGVELDTWYWKGKRNPPDIKNIIQAITSLPAWVPGSTISLLVKDGGSGDYARRVMAYDHLQDPAGLTPARLIVAYDGATSSSTFTSSGAQDGWILESKETSETGGSVDAVATTFRIGDEATDKQYRSILHFNTTLPSDAVITSATLRIKQQSINGTNPFTTLGNLNVDMRSPNFGNSATLVKGDFEATSDLLEAAIFDPNPSDDGWYNATLGSAALSHINLLGSTQFRLAFTVGDNDNASADYIAFFSGNNGADQPQLLITYYIP